MNNFRVKNSELVEKFNITDVMEHAIVGAIEEPYKDRNGDMQTPILLIQQQNVRKADADNSAIAALQGWNSGRLLRSITNVKSSVATQLNIKVGEPITVKGNSLVLSLQRQTEPFYESQDPMLNPQSGEVLTSGGKPVYENTEPSFTVNHVGMDIEFDQTKVDVEETHDVEEDSLV